MKSAKRLAPSCKEKSIGLLFVSFNSAFAGKTSLHSTSSACVTSSIYCYEGSLEVFSKLFAFESHGSVNSNI